MLAITAAITTLLSPTNPTRSTYHISHYQCSKAYGRKNLNKAHKWPYSMHYQKVILLLYKYAYDGFKFITSGFIDVAS